MKKLIPLLIAILIGLNLSSCDPEESFYVHYYKINFKNASNKDIKLIYHGLGSDGTDIGNINVTDTIVLNPNDKISFGGGGSKEAILEDNFKLIIEQNISEFNIFSDDISKFELYAMDLFIKEWVEPSGYFGDEINSPYNYDSWELVKYDEVLNPSYGEFIYGEIIFTITNKDLE